MRPPLKCQPTPAGKEELDWPSRWTRNPSHSLGSVTREIGTQFSALWKAIHWSRVNGEGLFGACLSALFPVEKPSPNVTVHFHHRFRSAVRRWPGASFSSRPPAHTPGRTWSRSRTGFQDDHPLPGPASCQDEDSGLSPLPFPSWKDFTVKTIPGAHDAILVIAVQLHRP